MLLQKARRFFLLHKKRKQMKKSIDDPVFDHCFRKLLAIEGDYVDDPSDSGGKTRYGITEKVARANGYRGEMSSLPLEFAKKIYKSCYWDVLSLDQVRSEKLCEELFDSAVNIGPSGVKHWWQECLNVLNNRGSRWEDLKVDGEVGEKTIAATNVACNLIRWEKRLVKLLNCVQGAFYKDLCQRREKDERFLGGWLDHRVMW